MFGQTGKTIGKKDFEAGAGGNLLERPIQTRTHTRDCELMFALQCMLSTKNVGLWSWGTKKVTVTSRNGKVKDTFVVPRITARRTKEDIFLDCKHTCATDYAAPAGKHLGRSLFMETLGKVVSGESKTLTAVDCVTGLLLHDTCNGILKMIKDLLARDQSNVKKHEGMLEVVRNFLKVQYIDHARKEDDCCTHGLVHALARPANYAEQCYTDSEPNTDSDFFSDSDDSDDDDEEAPTLKNSPVACDSDEEEEDELPERKPRRMMKTRSCNRKKKARAVVDARDHGGSNTRSDDSDASSNGSESGASGNGSDAANEASDASRNGSVAANEASDASRNGSVAANEASDASENGSVAAGEASDGSRNGSVAANEASDASKNGSVAANEASDASENGSVAAGEASDASENGSVAANEASDASGNRLGCDCNACKFPQYFLDQLGEEIKKEHCLRVDRVGERDDEGVDSPNVPQHERLDDALECLQDAGEKFRLHMAHKCRVAKQQDADKLIDLEMIEEVERSKGAGSKIKITIDWKMKWEQKSRLESTAEHCGKRGMSWHGCCVHCCRWHEDSDGEGFVQRVVVKMDQIMKGDTDQDAGAVLGMLEAILLVVEDEFPFIKEAVVASDNAGCCQNKELVLGMIMLNLMEGRKCFFQRHIHSETQDGKSSLDAHFSRGSRQVVKCVTTSPAVENKKVSSPETLAKALAWNGGTQNSMVQLIQMDRTCLKDLQMAMSGCCKEGLEYFSRANEIEILGQRMRKEGANVVDPKSWKLVEFEIRVWAHSNVDEGVIFRGCLGDGTFAPTSFQSLGEDTFVVDDDGSLDNDDLVFDLDSMFDEEEEIDLYLEDIQQWRKRGFAEAAELPVPRSPRFQRHKLLTGFTMLGMSDFGKIVAGSSAVRESKNAVSVEEVVEEEEEEEDDDESFEAAAQTTSSNPDVARAVAKIGAVGAAARKAAAAAKKAAEKEKRAAQKRKKKGVRDEPTNTTESKAAVPRALAMVGALVGSHSKIHSAKDGNLAMHNLAADFDLDSDHFRAGWARRPLSGNICGNNRMLEECHDHLCELVERGNQNKADKLNPQQMHASLWEKHHRHCIPSEHIIQREVKSILKAGQEDKGSKKKKPKLSRPMTKEEKELERLTESMKEASRSKVRQCGWDAKKMTPMHVFNRLAKKMKANKKQKSALSKPIRQYFSGIRGHKKARRCKPAKKSML